MISIVVMLILAGVSLNATVGDNGILTKAREAKITQEDATWYENAEMALTEAYMNEDVVDNIPEWIKQKFSEFSDDEVFVSEYMDGYLIVSGKRMITVDRNMQISSSKKNTYLVATGDDWYFLPNGSGTCKLTAYKLSLSGTITIPSVVTDKETGNVYMVTELADDIFNYATRITKVDFSSTHNLTKIGARAFAFCSNLEINVPEDLPSTITSIGDKAFYGCTKLNGNINSIKDKGYTLGKGVFMKCPNISGNIQDVFNENFYLDDDGNYTSTIIEKGQFSGYSGLTGVLTIPAYITSIGNNAFYGCTGITGIQFENGSQCESIGNSAFYQTSGITSNLTLPDNIKTIGNSAFAYSGITGLKLPNNLTTLGTYAFFFDENLTGLVEFPATLKTISSASFQNTKITSIKFNVVNENGIVNINSYAFYRCPSLTSASSSQATSFPNTLVQIGVYAFHSCKFETISLPNSLTYIGSNGFAQNTNMKITSWSTGLQTIANRGFWGDEALTLLPDKTSLKTIGSEAFLSCSSLGKNGANKTDIIEWLRDSNVTSISANAFGYCWYLQGSFDGTIKNKSSAGVAGAGANISISGSPFNNTSVTRSATLATNATTISANQFVGVTSITYNGTTYSGSGTLTLPSTITSIGANAFNGCSAISGIVIPDSVTTIGEYAFESSKVSSVTFSGTPKITKLSNGLFKKSTALKSFEIPSSVKEIGDDVFNQGAIRSIHIPSSVKSIGNSVFAWSSLNTITFDEGITTIGSSNFQGCDITNITIPDSVVNFGNSNFARNQHLKNITLGKGITKIPSSCFQNNLELNEIGCLETVTCRGKITSIGNNAFLKQPNLKEIKFVGGSDWSDIESIGTKAFYNCTSLTGSITLRNNCTVYEDSFENCPLEVSKGN